MAAAAEDTASLPAGSESAAPDAAAAGKAVTPLPAGSESAAPDAAAAGKAVTPLPAGSETAAPDAAAAGKAVTPVQQGKRKKREAAELVRQAKRAKLASEAMVVFGLGNLGTEAAKQRHNIGQQVLQAVIARTGAKALEDKEGAVGVFQLPGDGRRKLLVPPQGAINSSGPALKSALEALGHPNATVLAVVDDTALALGMLRFRQKGSSGGHNGLLSIEGIWGEDYHRLRLGINRAPAGGEQLKEHVLGEFQDAEKPLAEAIVGRAAEAVEIWLSLGPEEAEKVMAKVNSPSFRQVEV